MQHLHDEAPTERYIPTNPSHVLRVLLTRLEDAGNTLTPEAYEAMANARRCLKRLDIQLALLTQDEPFTSEIDNNWETGR